jgi:hypothetical protein
VGIKRLVRWALGPLLRWVARSAQNDDPWERLAYKVPLRTFGRGSYKPFRWYFEGETRVQVANLDDICAWLLECEYVHDPDLFNESDFWQHPKTFEVMRRGDCEDHAIWAWRKLVELGFEAELLSGDWQPAGDTAGGHVWVRFRQNGQEFIFEAVSRKRERMIRPFAEARSEYVPHAGVDHTFQHYGYVGFLRTMK